MKQALWGLSIVMAVGSVWGIALHSDSQMRIAKRHIVNPFLMSSIIKQKQSVIENSLIERLRKRKV